MHRSYDENSLAKSTIDRASKALQGDQSAGLPEVVELVKVLSGRVQDISVQELAQVVEKDATVLTKILSIANAFGYNPSHIPINTVSAAIQIIGFERIRTLALSLLLFEQSNRLQSPEERREAATMALFSGSLAKTAADALATVDAEEAFICASLRHFGRIVMLTFMADEYHQAQSLSAKRTEDEGFRQQFGVTPLELGHALLRAQNMPEEILSALQRFEPAKIGVAVTPSEQRLALAEFSEQVCGLVFDSTVGQDDFDRLTQKLSNRYARALPGLGEKMENLVHMAEKQLLNFTEGLGAQHFPHHFQRCLKSRITRTDPPPRKIARPDRHTAASAQPTSQDEAKPHDSAPREAAPPAQVPSSDAGAFDSLKKLVSDASTTDETLYSLALSIVSQSLAAPECILFLRPHGSTRELSVVHGLGTVWRTQRGRATIQSNEPTVFGLCLARRENILIHNADDASFKQHLPEWLRSGIGLGAFVLIPFVDRHANNGVLLAGWREPHRIEISSQHMATFHTLNQLLAGQKS